MSVNTICSIMIEYERACFCFVEIPFIFQKIHEKIFILRILCLIMNQSESTFFFRVSKIAIFTI